MKTLLIALVTVAVARPEPPVSPQYLPPSYVNGGSPSRTYGSPGLGGITSGNGNGIRGLPYPLPNQSANGIGGKPSLINIISTPASNGISVNGNGQSSSYAVPGLHGNTDGQPSYIYVPTLDDNALGSGNYPSYFYGVPRVIGNGRPPSTYQPSLSENSNANDNRTASSYSVRGLSGNGNSNGASPLSTYGVPGFSGSSESGGGAQPTSEFHRNPVNGGYENSKSGNVDRHPGYFGGLAGGGSSFNHRRPPNSYLPPSSNISGETQPSTEFDPTPVDGGNGHSNGGNVMDTSQSPLYGVSGVNGSSGGVGGTQPSSDFHPPSVDNGNEYENRGNVVDRRPVSLVGGSSGDKGFHNGNLPNNYLPPRTNISDIAKPSIEFLPPPVDGGNGNSNVGNVWGSSQSSVFSFSGLIGTSGGVSGTKQSSEVRPHQVDGVNFAGRHPVSFVDGKSGSSKFNNDRLPYSYIPPGNKFDIAELNGTSGDVGGTQQSSEVRPHPVDGGRENAISGKVAGGHPASFFGGTSGSSGFNTGLLANTYLPPRTNISDVTKPSTEFLPPPVNGGNGQSNVGNVRGTGKSTVYGVSGVNGTIGGVGGSQQSSEIRFHPVDGGNENAKGKNIVGRNPISFVGGTSGGSKFNNGRLPNNYLPPRTQYDVPGINGNSVGVGGTQQSSQVTPNPVDGGDEYAKDGNVVGRNPITFVGGTSGGSKNNTGRLPNTYLPPKTKYDVPGLKRTSGGVGGTQQSSQVTPNPVDGGNEYANGGNVVGTNPVSFVGGTSGGSKDNTGRLPNTYLPPKTKYDVPGLNGTSGGVDGTQKSSQVTPNPVDGGNEYANDGNIVGRNPISLFGGTGGGSTFNNGHLTNTYLPPKTKYDVPGLNGNSVGVGGTQQSSQVTPNPVDGGNEYAKDGNVVGRNPITFVGGTSGGSKNNTGRLPNTYLPPKTKYDVPGLKGTSGGVGGTQQSSQVTPNPVDGGNEYANGGNVVGTNPVSFVGGTSGGSNNNTGRLPKTYLPPKTKYDVPGLYGTSGDVGGTQQSSQVTPNPVDGGNEYANGGNVVGTNPISFVGGTGGGSKNNNGRLPNTYLPPKTKYDVPGLYGTSGGVGGTQQSSQVTPNPVDGGNEYANGGNVVGTNPISFVGGTGGVSKNNNGRTPNTYLPPKTKYDVPGLYGTSGGVGGTQQSSQVTPNPVDGGNEYANGGNVVGTNPISFVGGTGGGSKNNNGRLPNTYLPPKTKYGVPGLYGTSGGVGGTQQSSQVTPNPVDGGNEYANGGNVVGTNPISFVGGTGGVSKNNNGRTPNTYLPPKTKYDVPGLYGTSGGVGGTQQSSQVTPNPVDGGNEYANGGNVVGTNPISFVGGTGGGSKNNNGRLPNTYLPPKTKYGVPGLYGTSGGVGGTQQSSQVTRNPVDGGNEYAKDGNVVGTNPISFVGGTGGVSKNNNGRLPNTYLPPKTKYDVPGLYGTSGGVGGTQQSSQVTPNPVDGGNEYAKDGNVIGINPISFVGGTGGGSKNNNGRLTNTYLPPKTKYGVPGLYGTSGGVGGTQQSSQVTPNPVDGGNEYANGGNVVGTNPISFVGGTGGVSKNNNGRLPNTYLPSKTKYDVPGLYGTSGGVGGTQQSSQVTPNPVDGGNEYANGGNVVGANPISFVGGTGGGSKNNNGRLPNTYLPPKTKYDVPGLYGTSGGVGGTQQSSQVTPNPVDGGNEYAKDGNVVGINPISFVGGTGGGSKNNNGRLTNTYLPPKTKYGVPGLYGTSGGVGGTQQSSQVTPNPVDGGNEYANGGNVVGRNPISFVGGTGGGSKNNNGRLPNTYLPPRTNIYGGTQPSSDIRHPTVDEGIGHFNNGNLLETSGFSSEFGDSGKILRDGGCGGKDECPTGPDKHDFNYVVNDAGFGTQFGHQQSQDGDQAQGPYSVLLPDGRQQIVDYVADNKGNSSKTRYEGEANDPSGRNVGYPPSLNGNVRGDHVPELNSSVNGGVRGGFVPELSDSVNGGYPHSVFGGVIGGHVPEPTGGVRGGNIFVLNGGGNVGSPPGLNGGVRGGHIFVLNGSGNVGFPPNFKGGVTGGHKPELNGGVKVGSPPGLNGDVRGGHIFVLNGGGNVGYLPNLNGGVTGGHKPELNGGVKVGSPPGLNGDVRGGHIFVLNSGGNVGFPLGISSGVRGGHIFLLNGGGNVGFGLNDGERGLEYHAVETNRNNGYPLEQSGSVSFGEDGYRY